MSIFFLEYLAFAVIIIIAATLEVFGLRRFILPVIIVGPLIIAASSLWRRRRK